MTPHPAPSSLRKEACIWILLAMLLSGLSTHFIFHHQTITGDEGSYLFQAHNFAEGQIRRDFPPFHRQMKYDQIILRPQDGWLSRYSPGHPLWLVPGVWLGWPQAMGAVAAGLCMGCVFFLGIRLGLPRFLVPLLLLASPIFAVMHGTLLSHSSGMAALALMCLAYVAWRQDGTLRWPVCCGLAWAFFFLNRTWTALLVALPFGIDSLWQLWVGRSSRQTWIQTCAFAGTAALGVALYMAYNQLSTGDMGTATYLHYEPTENLGFGPRRVQGGSQFRIDHTPALGLANLWTNLRAYDQWLFGVQGGLVAWLALAFYGAKRRWTPILLGLALMVCVGYVFFWFPGIFDVGPIYYTETLPAVLLAGSFGLARLWRLPRWAGTGGKAIAALLILGLATGSFRFTLNQKAILWGNFGAKWQMMETLYAEPGRTLVFFPSFDKHPHLRRFTGLNPRGLESRVLQMESRATYNPLIAACFPDRKAFELVLDPTPHLVPLSGAALPQVKEARHTACAQNVGATDETRRHAEGSRHQAGFFSYGWYVGVPPGDYEMRFDLRLRGASPDMPTRVEIASNLGRDILATVDLTDADAPVVLRFRVDKMMEVEPRIWFGGTGSLELTALVLDGTFATQP